MSRYRVIYMFHRLAVGLLIISALTLCMASSAIAELSFVTRGHSNRIIIFIDGLQADAGKAFRWGEGVGSWPELMAADASSEARQLPLERYDSAILSFNGIAADHGSVPQLAIRGLADLKAKGIIETYESIVFVAHGAGGLVLKSMMVQSSTAGSSALPAKSKAIFLISVPAQGRPAANFLSALASHQALAVNFGTLDVAVFLQGLESLWSEYLAKRGPTKRFEVYCRHESIPTFGVAVAAGQYTTEGCDDNSEDRTADHQSIARPASRDAGVYRWVRTHLGDYFARNPSDPGKTKAGTEVAVAAPTSPPALLEPLPIVPLSATGAIASENVPVKPAEALTPAPPAAAIPDAPTPTPTTTVATPPAMRAAPEAGRNIRSRRPSASFARPSLRNGDWTFYVRGDNCNLLNSSWIVTIQQKQLTSESWDAKIRGDGKFVINTSGFCSTELVRGQVAGRSGTGWYLYSNPCLGLYCRARFHLTWRHQLVDRN